jgi:hypothetical protein
MMNQILGPKSLRFLALALACFALAPVAQTAPRPKPGDRDNGSSAAEKVSALNPATTGSNNTAHGWYSLYSNTVGNAWAGQVSSPAIWRCQWWDGRSCTSSDLSDPRLRHIVILSSGYPDGFEERFWSDFRMMIDRMSSDQAGNAWSVQKRDRILYIGAYTGGGPLGSETATFGSHIIEDPLGLPTLAARDDEVFRFVEDAQMQMPWLRPLGAAVLCLFAGQVAPNSAPPSFVNKSFGVAKMSSRDNLASGYIATHEMAHAALNFLDEYVEAGFENININQLEILAPRLVFGWSQLPPDVYDYRMSEILAGNGPENLAVRHDVTTVRTPGVAPQRYEYEGGLFFGRGTFHDTGSNLMNSDYVQRGPRDGFAYAHSRSQQQVIDAAFGESAYRANDRLRNAGPRDGWDQAGANVDLLLYDADKNNSFHRTRQYQVEVAWWEHTWRTEIYTVPAQLRVADLPFRGDVPEEELLRLVACRAGMTDPTDQLNGFEVCDRQNSAFLPTFTFYTPYERTTVPASQQFTRYWWHFRTYNGVQYSGWTGWSSFYRSF